MNTDQRQMLKRMYLESKRESDQRSYLAARGKLYSGRYAEERNLHRSMAGITSGGSPEEKVEWAKQAYVAGHIEVDELERRIAVALS
jgi:hypothetical protein